MLDGKVPVVLVRVQADTVMKKGLQSSFLP